MKLIKEKPIPEVNCMIDENIKYFDLRRSKSITDINLEHAQNVDYTYGKNMYESVLLNNELLHKCKWLDKYDSVNQNNKSFLNIGDSASNRIPQNIANQRNLTSKEPNAPLNDTFSPEILNFCDEYENSDTTRSCTSIYSTTNSEQQQLERAYKCAERMEKILQIRAAFMILCLFMCILFCFKI